MDAFEQIRSSVLPDDRCCRRVSFMLPQEFLSRDLTFVRDAQQALHSFNRSLLRAPL